MTDLASIMSIYSGSDGDLTKALYEQLAACGPIGLVAIDLFRACKASERAKVYRGGVRGKGSFRHMAYDRKDWAVGNLIRMLGVHADRLGIDWGWGEDKATPGYSWVLYVDLPTGQVSFHSAYRSEGPSYGKAWDGVRGASAQRICAFCHHILAGRQ